MRVGSCSEGLCRRGFGFCSEGEGQRREDHLGAFEDGFEVGVCLFGDGVVIVRDVIIINNK